jgi:hypothetical protein
MKSGDTDLTGLRNPTVDDEDVEKAGGVLGEADQPMDTSGDIGGTGDKLGQLLKSLAMKDAGALGAGAASGGAPLVPQHLEGAGPTGADLKDDSLGRLLKSLAAKSQSSVLADRDGQASEEVDPVGAHDPDETAMENPTTRGQDVEKAGRRGGAWW